MPSSLQIKGKLKFYSRPLCRQWKWRYQVHGKMTEPKLILPASLAHVQYTDPLRESLGVKQPLQAATRQRWLPPRRHPNLEFLFPKATLADRVDYQRTPVKLFDARTRLHAGIEQASLLTKTVPVLGLPHTFTQLATRLRDPSNVSHFDSISL